nr:hypothetical protein [uncultured Anaerobutyricum sp.]
MEDRIQLEKILSYIERQQCIERKIMTEDEEDHKKVQEIWKQKVWRGYVELKDAGFKEGQELFLTAAYFAGKPDETVTPLLRRLKMVMKDREDIISGGMLAASYYGEEELAMRIPVLEDGAGNLYKDKKCVEALTGSIMIADGGPAEVAKAIQWYMFLLKNGFDMNEHQVARLIGILAVISSSPNLLGQELLKRAKENMASIKNNTEEKELQKIFYEETCTYIKELQQKEQERTRKLDRTSYKMLTGEKNVTAADYAAEETISLNGSNLLTGMQQEVNLVLAAIHFEV